MKKLTQLLIILTLGMLSQFLSAQVERSQLTSSIENREPVDNLENFVQGQNNEIKRIYFFTQITGLGNTKYDHLPLDQVLEQIIPSACPSLFFVRFRCVSSVFHLCFIGVSSVFHLVL